jgi:hypothetical protein
MILEFWTFRETIKVRLTSFESEIDDKIAKLSKELSAGQYSLSAIKRVEMPKGDG